MLKTSPEKSTVESTTPRPIISLPNSENNSFIKSLPISIKQPIRSVQKTYQKMSLKNRVLRELKNLEKSTPDGVSLILTENIHVLYADITIKGNELYKEGEKYRLKMMIPENYPFVAPISYFIKNNAEDVHSIPIHPHIYSNGHICLDLLGPAWTPAYTIDSLIVAIQSILASNDINERPPDDDRYVKKAPKNPQKTSFVYHDDTI
ncbi:hypothetical protein WICMUC_002088 [Wickerhamomyces mucosus]|uniref:UBC core domain-containing protein n=1 Tax=Wickerhamomyces mucosus TaxID=1378264 RepID=A0A9P8PQA5_9ASCO|nr:hypothetical protein WICMUC_002088 [Wickerhamomyces mucosus]